MCVFMRVEVRDDQSGGLQLSNLRRGLGFDLVGINPSTNRGQSEADEALSEMSVALGQRWKSLRTKHGRAVGQHHMAADAKPGRRLGALHAVVERRSIGHQSRGSYDAPGMPLSNSAIDAGSKPKIIRINNKPPHATV